VVLNAIERVRYSPFSRRGERKNHLILNLKLFPRFSPGVFCRHTARTSCSFEPCSVYQRRRDNNTRHWYCCYKKKSSPSVKKVKACRIQWKVWNVVCHRATTSGTRRCEAANAIVSIPSSTQALLDLFTIENWSRSTGYRRIVSCPLLGTETRSNDTFLSYWSLYNA
jgi:hypothetical protein